MRTKTVKRHWCDFCNRAGLQAHAMAKHERHCTMNPARACRVCQLSGNEAPDAAGLRALIALLPTPVVPDYDHHGNHSPRFDQFLREAAEVEPKLRAAANGCPACMLAAIRQAGVPVPLVAGFDFKKEMADLLAEIAREEQEQRAEYHGAVY